MVMEEKEVVAERAHDAFVCLTSSPLLCRTQNSSHDDELAWDAGDSWCLFKTPTREMRAKPKLVSKSAFKRAHFMYFFNQVECKHWFKLASARI